MSEREQLLHEYRAMCFGVQDIKLFLDTHPFHSEALGAFSHYCRAANILKKEYETKFGPLTACAAPQSNCWQWIEGPWPWEYEGGK